MNAKVPLHLVSDIPGHWYLVQCKPQEGFRAAANLSNQGYHCYHPSRQVSLKNPKPGGPRTRWESLFPFYLFLFVAENQGFSTIRSTRGVTKLVSFSNGQPKTVPASVVRGIMSLCNRINGEPVEPLYKPGDRLTITEGCFKELQGICKQQRGEDRVVLLLNLLNKEQELELPLSAVKSG